MMECMGGGLYEHVYRGCDFQSGYKHAMNWLPDTRMVDLTPESLDPYGATFALGGVERVGITPASQLNFMLGLRTPSPSGMLASWVYVTHRSVSPVAAGAMQLNEVTQNWDSLWHDGAADAAVFTNNSMGHAYLIDAVPYTLDQADADVDAGASLRAAKARRALRSRHSPVAPFRQKSLSLRVAVVAALRSASVVRAGERGGAQRDRAPASPAPQQHALARQFG